MNRTENEALALQTILDTMADGVYFIDQSHIIRRWNQAMTRLTGYTAAEALGRPCSMLRSKELHGESGGLGMVDRALSDAGLISGEEVLVRRKDGRRIPMLISARQMKDAAGKVLGAVITFTDLSRIKRLEAENRLLRQEMREQDRFHGLVGHSSRMREVFRMITLAAQSEETILVLGETGTGKELAARAIHHLSERREGPLVTVNCSALSESLLESELFGHVKGAFTGAVRDYIGRFESAAGGAIFLDEVGELPPLVQVKLLRVLQERTIERVGEGRPRPVNVRVIAATHRDLRAQVQAGAFREDLFYRLNVFPIHLPPLRERREDVEPLLQHFIEKAAARTGKEITGLAPDAMRMLMDHCWPGNVRELENAVAHAFITCPGGEIGPFDLPVELRRMDIRQRICSAAERQDAAEAPARPMPRPRRISREVLLECLEQCDWNKSEAARRLNMDRSTLWRRMKNLGIPMQPEA